MGMLLTPLLIACLTLLDLAYLAISLIIFPLIKIVNMIWRARINPELVNKSLQTVFNLNYNQMQGFRRLRQVSQLNFESFPQIILQVRILLYVWDEDSATQDELGVSATQILISLFAAFIHTLGEIYLLRRESIACKIDFFNYIVVCYNGRLEWVPFLNNFESLNTFQMFYRKWAIKSPTDNSYLLVLDFDEAEY